MKGGLIVNGCLIKIRQGLPTFSPAEQKVGNFILNNLNEVLELSITKLAQKSETSEASVVRFCRSLGIKGYQELKILIAGDLREPEDGQKIIHKNINDGDDTATVIKKICDSNISSIQDTMKVLSSSELEQAVNFLDNAKRMIFFGVGASSIVALDAQYKFMRINMDASMYFDTDMQLTAASNLGEGDVAIGITNSGRTIDTVKALKIAKGNGAKTICITQFGDSPVLEYADVRLHMAVVESNFRSGAMASRIAQLSIIDALFVGVARKRYNQVIDYLEKTREVVSDKKY